MKRITKNTENFFIPRKGTVKLKSNNKNKMEKLKFKVDPKDSKDIREILGVSEELSDALDETLLKLFMNVERGICEDFQSLCDKAENLEEYTFMVYRYVLVMMKMKHGMSKLKRLILDDD